MVVSHEKPPAVDNPVRDIGDEVLYLTGRPSLKQFLKYVRSHEATCEAESKLCDEWHAARSRIQQIRNHEAGIADEPKMTPITSMGSEYEQLLIEFLKDPLVRNSFNTVPTEVAMIDLDRVVVWQKHIDLTYVRQLEDSLGASLTPENIFRTCLPFDHPQPPVKWLRQHHDRWVFVSPSNDLRFLSAVMLDPHNIRDYAHSGTAVGVLGLAVGFGSNFMNALYAGNRLILNNGSHRAYALRKMGVTHVPCIVQHASINDEIDLVATSEITSDRKLYFQDPRPPMLVDYFNPGLHMVFPVHRRLRQITLRFEVEESFIPAL